MDNINFENLSTNKCAKEEWNDVLDILKETEQDICFTGEEKYEDYYAVKLSNVHEIIGCFTIAQENEIGILKHLGIKTRLQRQGIGKYLSENVVPKIAKERRIKKLYLLGNNRGPYTAYQFWNKTFYKHIKASEIKDKFFLDYYNHTIKIMPKELFLLESVFYLDV